jgi:hypothetical protein
MHMNNVFPDMKKVVLMDILMKMMRLEVASLPCAEGYIINPDYPECRLREYVCEEHPTLRDCMTEVTNVQNVTSRILK